MKIDKSVVGGTFIAGYMLVLSVIMYLSTTAEEPQAQIKELEMIDVGTVEPCIVYDVHPAVFYDIVQMGILEWVDACEIAIANE